MTPTHQKCVFFCREAGAFTNNPHDFSCVCQTEVRGHRAARLGEPGQDEKHADKLISLLGEKEDQQLEGEAQEDLRRSLQQLKPRGAKQKVFHPSCTHRSVELMLSSVFLQSQAIFILISLLLASTCHGGGGNRHPANRIPFTCAVHPKGG